MSWTASVVMAMAVSEAKHLAAEEVKVSPETVMTVEQRGRGHEPHRVYRDVQSAPHRGSLRIVWKSDATASR